MNYLESNYRKEKREKQQQTKGEQIACFIFLCMLLF